jgi:MSHA biogenesis protein MshO
MSAGATRSLLANDVSACTFTYAPGTAQRAGLMTLDITIARAVTGGSTEQVRLLNQVHVEYIGIIAHCLLNLIGTLVLFAQLLG